MKKKPHILTALFFLTIFASHTAQSFTADDILSPRPGTWNNIQALVLQNTEHTEIYYSLTGTDPLVSGFAYDGPVVIDQEEDIRLHITALDASKNRSDFIIQYTVLPAQFKAQTSEEQTFVQNISQNPIRKYSSGTHFYIPPRFYYTFSLTEDPSIAARALHLSAQNTIERYIPCTVGFEENRWHFIIHIVTSKKPDLSAQTIPFTFTDWTTIDYTGSGIIYQLDEEYWTASRDTLSIERDVPHTLRWQSIQFSQKNPIYELEIPPKPSIGTAKNEADGSTSFFLTEGKSYNGVPYLLGKPSAAEHTGTVSGLFATVTADIFYGESIHTPLELGVYYGGVYQGDIAVPLSIDKQPPLPPQFNPSTHDAYSRNQVELTIIPPRNAEQEEADVFFAISAPSQALETSAQSNTAELASALPQEFFRLYNGETIILNATNDGATFYLAAAYTVDKAGNKSELVTYSVTIDEANFYLDTTHKAKDVLAQDGTKAHPFTSFEEALNAINAREYTRLHITGDVSVEKKYTIHGSCLFIGKESQFTFSPAAHLTIQNAAVSFQSCILKKMSTGEKKKSQEASLFDISAAHLTFRDCEALLQTRGQEPLISAAQNASVSLENTGLTVQSSTYACAISASNSTVSIRDSRVTVSAPNCVAVSVNGGWGTVSHSALSINARLGRCLELSHTKAAIISTQFNAPLFDSSGPLLAIWNDADTIFVRNENNEETRF